MVCLMLMAMISMFVMFDSMFLHHPCDQRRDAFVHTHINVADGMPSFHAPILTQFQCQSRFRLQLIISILTIL